MPTSGFEFPTKSRSVSLAHRRSAGLEALACAADVLDDR